MYVPAPKRRPSSYIVFAWLALDSCCLINYFILNKKVYIILYFFGNIIADSTFLVLAIYLSVWWSSLFNSQGSDLYVWLSLKDFLIHMHLLKETIESCYNWWVVCTDERDIIKLMIHQQNDQNQVPSQVQIYLWSGWWGYNRYKAER